jgi:hypothetical protein
VHERALLCRRACLSPLKVRKARGDWKVAQENLRPVSGSLLHRTVHRGPIVVPVHAEQGLARLETAATRRSLHG